MLYDQLFKLLFDRPQLFKGIVLIRLVKGLE